MGGKKRTSFVGDDTNKSARTNILKIFNDSKINKYVSNTGSAYFFTHKQIKSNDIYVKRDD